MVIILDCTGLEVDIIPLLIWSQQRDSLEMTKIQARAYLQPARLAQPFKK